MRHCTALMGQIALIAAIVTFVLAGVTLLLSGFGLWHYRRVPVEEEIPVRRHHAHRPQAGTQPLVAALATRSLRPEPRSGNPSRGTGALG